jgi:helix-turn-helix protein
MARLAATLPGYASVARASEVLHLAPRSVRDLIYAGRIPSLRIGRLHYIRSADLEAERRRRLGLPVRRRQPRQPTESHRTPRPAAPRNHSLDGALRRQRAAERAEIVTRWVQRHGLATPTVPAHVLAVASPVTCEVCSRVLRQGRYVSFTPSPDTSNASATLCVACGRRALLEWADRRRQEATAAREMAHSLGQPESAPVDPRPAELLQQVLLPSAPAEATTDSESPPTNPRAA